MVQHLSEKQQAVFAHVEKGLDLCQHVRRQLLHHRQTREVVHELLDARGPEDDRRDESVRAAPREGELRE